MKKTILCSFVSLATTVSGFSLSQQVSPRSPTRLYDTSIASLETRAAQLMIQSSSSDKFPVKVAPVSTDRLGLVATQRISKGQVVLSLPCQEDDDFPVLTAKAAQQVFQTVLPESLDSWTGDAGFMAMLLLHHVAEAAQEQQPSFRTAWLQALPTIDEMAYHPYFWSETDQEILQLSSTNKIYQRLDDMEEDFGWWKKHVFEQNRQRFPEFVNDTPCFSWTGFQWAMAIVQSRSFFLDGALRCIPLLDMCNHDNAAEEIQTSKGFFFGGGANNKNAQLIADRNYEVGQEVFCSYGPKSAADYLLEHGFCPLWTTAVSELTFELDPNDRFRDDKLDILEFETYDQAPMDPMQTFDVVSTTKGGGESPLDPAMLQFLRLCQLGNMDAFLLESIFRKDVWGFMALPVSEQNELAVMNVIGEACQRALDEFAECPEGGPAVCTQLRQAEAQALTKTIVFVNREKEALDLKEYYQERRLKDLGLDSEWTPEDEVGDDLSFGQTRAPGGADYDW